MPTKEWWATEWDRSEYDRKRYQAAKQRLIELLGGRCQICGSTEGLQFDHVDPDLKRFAITERWNRSQEALREELDKCQLLCEPHHREKTKADGRLGGGWNKLPEEAFQHGMARNYLKKGCRCVPCKAAGSLYKKKLVSIDEICAEGVATGRESASKTDSLGSTPSTPASHPANARAAAGRPA